MASEPQQSTEVRKFGNEQIEVIYRKARPISESADKSTGNR
jgi:hypothetical protein